MGEQRRILVDMDGVLADFEKGFLDEWKREHPDLPYVPIRDRRTFYHMDQYPAEHKDLIYEIVDRPYFYGNLEPIRGGREALEEMRGLGWDVRICTSPSISNYEGCVPGKFMWVHKYLGKDWLHRLVLTKDKTIVDGDVLIDDKSRIDGIVARPSWEHVLYDQPHNRWLKMTKRLTWENWKEVLGV